MGFRLFIESRAAEEQYKVSNDYHQLSNPEHAKALARMRKLLDEWTEQTGDTCPNELTGDILLRSSRNEPIREAWKGYIPRQRGTTPGSERNATTIHHSGPR
jgi:N-sulfoglucosamine sulfohydrolase